jgi:glycerol-3-phosphate acyltransferase PlsY
LNPILVFLPCGLAAYLAGAIPFGYLVARARGADIRALGSGNIGATNVWRNLGRVPGALTFLADAAKGFAPAFVFPAVAARWNAADPVALGALCACLAVVGHNWPVFLRFSGGKGVATTIGALLGFAPAAVGVMLCAWLAVFLPSRYVSLASMAGVLALAASSWLLYRGQGPLRPAALTLLAAMAIWRHRANIRRLIEGTEHRVAFRGSR